MNVPAWPIPIHQTKLVMAKAQATGMLLPQTPMPVRTVYVTATTSIDFVTATKGDTVTLSGGNGRPITVRIPAGVTDGQKLKLRGKGEPSADGGEAGDLVLTVHVDKHPVFERDGLNLRVNVPVTWSSNTLSGGATVTP